MFFEKPDRKIIPRWRDFLTTAGLRELNSSTPKFDQQPWPEATLAETRYAWTEHKTLWHALDFVGSAFSLGISDLDAVEAARFILLNHANSSPEAGLTLAGRILSGTFETPAVQEVQDESPETRRSEIHRTRRRTVNEPRNAIAWIDLARLYTIEGHIPQAQRAIEIALKLSPANRFVLRSACRFFVHAGDRERAVRLLRAAENFDDPWITAAEIGVSALEGKAPHQAKQGRHLLADANVTPFAKTELASALATLELQGGRNGLARKLFRQSLTDPNENSLAQAEWASTKVGELKVEAQTPSVIRGYEAKALLGLRIGDWELTAKNSMDWLRDQPFSSRPAGVASYIFSVIYDQQERAENILRRSLISNPRDPLLTNNLAFALANQDKTDKAEEALSTLPAEVGDDEARVTLLATTGLVMFRKGLIEEGRRRYLSAIDLAKRKALGKFEALAAIYLAREELIAKMPESTQDLQRAEELSSKRDEPDVAFVLNKVSQLTATAE